MKKTILYTLVLLFFMMAGTAFADNIKIYPMSNPAIGQTYSADAFGTLKRGVTYGIHNNSPLKLYLCGSTGCYTEIQPWFTTSVTMAEDTAFQLLWKADRVEIHFLPAGQVSVPVVIYPEDEVGSYTLNENGEKVYNWFNNYSICMYFMGDEEFCSRFPR